MQRQSSPRRPPRRNSRGSGLSSDLPIHVPPWLGVGAMLATARLLLAAACWHRRAFAAGAEVSRKLLHVAIGTSFLALPWLFHDARPVLVLCAGFMGLLLLRRVVP